MALATARVVLLTYLIALLQHLQLAVHLVKFALFLGCALLQLLFFMHRRFVHLRSYFEDHRF